MENVNNTYNIANNIMGIGNKNKPLSNIEHF